jgi:YbbR domain-containing protein
VRRNIWLKIASVVLAVALWVFVISRGHSSISMAIPLEFENIPQGLMVVQTATMYSTAVGLKGHERLIKNLTSEDVQISLDLDGLPVGNSQINIEKDNIKLPIFVRLINMNPSTITVTLEETSEKSVPVKPDIVGEPRKGFKVMRMKVSPGNVTVAGGESELKKLKGVRTEPIDISEATKTLKREVKVASPGGNIRPVTESVTVEIVIVKARR